MTKDLLRYDRMVENALKGVVREALEHVAENGLPGSHHIYLTFSTTFPGVDMPNSLMEKYPSEMTIVLQYQFWDLAVLDDHFTVSLSFNDIREKLYIPFAAVTAFADPSVNFALQFQVSAENDEANDPVDVARPLLVGNNREQPNADEERDKDLQSDKKSVENGNVVALDAFRKD